MPNVYLDTNVYIVGLLDPNTNSALIMREIKERDVIVVQSDYLFDEVIQWFRAHKGKDWASKARLIMLTLPKTELIHHFEWSLLLNEWKGSVDDEDDLPHICSYFAGNCEYFVTANRRLAQMKIKKDVNFCFPREFVENILEIKGLNTPRGV